MSSTEQHRGTYNVAGSDISVDFIAAPSATSTCPIYMPSVLRIFGAPIVGLSFFIAGILAGDPGSQGSRESR